MEDSRELPQALPRLAGHRISYLLTYSTISHNHVHTSFYVMPNQVRHATHTKLKRICFEFLARKDFVLKFHIECTYWEKKNPSHPSLRPQWESIHHMGKKPGATTLASYFRAVVKIVKGPVELWCSEWQSEWSVLWDDFETPYLKTEIRLSSQTDTFMEVSSPENQWALFPLKCASGYFCVYTVHFSDSQTF